MSSPAPAETLSGLLQTSRFGIIAVDSAGNLRVWNPGAERLFGWKKEEVMGRPANAAFQLQTLPQGELPLRLPRKDGSLIDVDGWTGPWRDDHGNAQGTLAIVSETTP